MRVAGAVILSVFLAILPVAAAWAQTLTPGRPAGIHAAQEKSFTWLYFTAGTLALAGVGVLISSDSSSSTILKLGTGGDKTPIVVSPTNTVSVTTP